MPIQRTITYEVGGGARRRLSVARCNAMAVARYNVYRREGFDWLDTQKLGRSVDEAEDEISTLKRLWMIDRAHCLSALTEVAEAAEGSDDFVVVELPEEWQTVEGFLEDVPAVVFAAWAEASREVNPGLWVAFTDAEKNAVAVIVA